VSIAGLAVEGVAAQAEIFVVEAHIGAGPAVPLHAALAIGDIAFAIITVGVLVAKEVACS
jgi:hypothetical protein